MAGTELRQMASLSLPHTHTRTLLSSHSQEILITHRRFNSLKTKKCFSPPEKKKHTKISLLVVEDREGK